MPETSGSGGGAQRKQIETEFNGLKNDLKMHKDGII